MPFEMRPLPNVSPANASTVTNLFRRSYHLGSLKIAEFIDIFISRKQKFQEIDLLILTRFVDAQQNKMPLNAFFVKKTICCSSVSSKSLYSMFSIIIIPRHIIVI